MGAGKPVTQERFGELQVGGRGLAHKAGTSPDGPVVGPFPCRMTETGQVLAVRTRWWGLLRVLVCQPPLPADGKYVVN